MKFEDLAAPPPRVSPQMRYATLHRAVENGLSTDRTWSELIEVCLELGRDDEAVASLRQVQDATLRRRLLARLHSRGLMQQMELAADGSFRKRRLTEPAPARSASGTHRQADAAPARSASGTRRPAETELPRSELGELIGDAFRFLFLDHMPLTVIVATVTFPLVIGLGGFLSSSVGPSAYFAMSLLAIVPAVSALALVGALARRILLDANRGLIDPPAIPTFSQLSGEALRFGGDALVLGLVFLGPGILLHQLLGATHVGAALSALAVGGCLLPMALTLRSTRDDWSALHLGPLCSEIRKIGSRYAGVVTVTWLLMSPAIAGLLLTTGSQTYMSISVVGPLVVAPLFVSARLLGHVMYESRRAERRVATLQGRTGAGRKRTTQARPTAGRAMRSSAAAIRTRAGAPTHPESRSTARRPASPPPAAQQRPPQPGAEHNPPLRRRQPATAAARSAPAPAAKPRRGIDALPDLTNLPGATVFRGAARKAAGAAAARRDQQR